MQFQPPIDLANGIRGYRNKVRLRGLPQPAQVRQSGLGGFRRGGTAETRRAGFGSVGAVSTAGKHQYIGGH